MGQVNLLLGKWKKNFSAYLPTPRVQKSGDVKKSLHCETVIKDNVQE